MKNQNNLREMITAENDKKVFSIDEGSPNENIPHQKEKNP